MAGTYKGTLEALLATVIDGEQGALNVNVVAQGAQPTPMGAYKGTPEALLATVVDGEMGAINVNVLSGGGGGVPNQFKNGLWYQWDSLSLADATPLALLFTPTPGVEVLRSGFTYTLDTTGVVVPEKGRYQLTVRVMAAQNSAQGPTTLAFDTTASDIPYTSFIPFVVPSAASVGTGVYIVGEYTAPWEQNAGDKIILSITATGVTIGTLDVQVDLMLQYLGPATSL